MYAGIPGLRIPTSYILMNGNTPALLKKKDLERFCQGLVQQESAMKRLQ
jgi:hypothetical protein